MCAKSKIWNTRHALQQQFLLSAPRLANLIRHDCDSEIFHVAPAAATAATFVACPTQIAGLSALPNSIPQRATPFAVSHNAHNSKILNFRKSAARSFLLRCKSN